MGGRGCQLQSSLLLFSPHFPFPSFPSVLSYVCLWGTLQAIARGMKRPLQQKRPQAEPSKGTLQSLSFSMCDHWSQRMRQMAKACPNGTHASCSSGHYRLLLEHSQGYKHPLVKTSRHPFLTAPMEQESHKLRLWPESTSLNLPALGLSSLLWSPIEELLKNTANAAAHRPFPSRLGPLPALGLRDLLLPHPLCPSSLLLTPGASLPLT